jgi:hypothetical protein
MVYPVSLTLYPDRLELLHRRTSEFSSPVDPSLLPPSDFQVTSSGLANLVDCKVFRLSFASEPTFLLIHHVDSSQTRVFELKATSDAVAQEWVDALVAAIATATNAVAGNPASGVLASVPIVGDIQPIYRRRVMSLHVPEDSPLDQSLAQQLESKVDTTPSLTPIAEIPSPRQSALYENVLPLPDLTSKTAPSLSPPSDAPPIPSRSRASHPSSPTPDQSAETPPARPPRKDVLSFVSTQSAPEASDSRPVSECADDSTATPPPLPSRFRVELPDCSPPPVPPRPPKK